MRKQERSTLEGLVLDAAHGNPLSGAQVTLKPVYPSDGSSRTVVSPSPTDRPIPPRNTTAYGAFRFEDVAPGRSRIHAVCNGYARSEYGKRGDSEGTSVILGAGQNVSRLNVSLDRAAILAG